MTAFIDIEMVGDSAQVQRMLSYLNGLFSPPGMSAFLAATVGPYLESRARDRFMSEGDDVSGVWAPLESSTEEVRARYQVGASGPINRRTGELEDYITGQGWGLTAHALGATLQFPKNPPRSQAVREKMTAAQTGRTSPPTVPRPVLGVNERDLAFVVTSLAFLIEKGSPP